MKLLAKKLLYITLAGGLFITPILCCCLTSSVEAKETTPSCHKASSAVHHQQRAPETQECDCQKMVSTQSPQLIYQITLQSSHLEFSGKSFLLQGSRYREFEETPLIIAYQGPPSTSILSNSLYLQNSILRL